MCLMAVECYLRRVFGLGEAFQYSIGDPDTADALLSTSTQRYVLHLCTPSPPLVSNLSNNNVVFCNASTLDSAVYPMPARLLDILLAARQNGGPRQVLDLVGQTLATIFQLGFLSDSNWKRFEQEPGFSTML